LSLIEKGANVNAMNLLRETPLHIAVQNKTIRSILVKLLIKHGADVNAREKKGMTPLHIAIRQSREEVILKLIGGGAYVNMIETESGKTPLKIAYELGEINIISRMEQIVELQEFLSKLKMDKYLTNFVNEELFQDVLHDVTDTILKTIGVDEENVKILAQACRENFSSNGSKKKLHPALLDSLGVFSKELEYNPTKMKDEIQKLTCFEEDKSSWFILPEELEYLEKNWNWCICKSLQRII